jgi:Flp pilus assembly protein TadG
MKRQSLARTYSYDQRGAVAIWTALALPAILASAALSVDLARLYNMDNDLQSAADAMSRAAAGELDQRADSLARAERAVSSLVTNRQIFANDGPSAVEVGKVVYLKELPTSDEDAIPASMITEDPKEARFVSVTVKPKTVSTVFPVSTLKTIIDTEMTATSTATLETGICGSAPVFLCNPFEGTGVSLEIALNQRQQRRKLVQFKQGSSGTKMGPGNFGYLDPFGGSASGSEIRDAMGLAQTNACVFAASGVTTRPGNVSSVRFAFNTRFDMYGGPYKSSKNDPAYAPAENVTRGYSGAACNQTPDSSAMGLPRDACFLDGSCGGQLGDGDWDFVNYIRVNHNAPSSLDINGTRYYFDYGTAPTDVGSGSTSSKKKSGTEVTETIPGTVTPSDIPTRYEVYRWEIDTDSIPGAKSYGTSITPEEGTPVCHADGPSNLVEDRRVVQAAVVNCNALDAVGFDINGRTSGVPVESFVKVFLTEPMGSGGDAIIWGEMIEPVIFGQDVGATDTVKIVR